MSAHGFRLELAVMWMSGLIYASAKTQVNVSAEKWYAWLEALVGTPPKSQPQIVQICGTVPQVNADWLSSCAWGQMKHKQLM